MLDSSNIRRLPLALALSVGMGLASTTAVAVDYSAGYQYDMSGNIVRGADGKCLRTLKWSAENALAVCDPDAVRQFTRDIPKPKVARVTSVTPVTAVFTLLADESFAFGSSRMSAAGKQGAADAVGQFAGQYIHRINIVGYTDRIGSADYNQRLSEARANTVKAELVSLGVPEERIYPEGRGMASPLVECDMTDRHALIRCLAPNRRVEVGVIIPKIAASGMEAQEIRVRKDDSVEGADITDQATVIDTGLVAPVINHEVKKIGNTCSKEINTFCVDVPLGNFRIYDCLKTHEAEVSAACATAMAEGYSAVEAALGDVNFFGAQCGPDMKSRCPEIALGSGEILNCLKAKIDTVSKRCVNAMLQVGIIHTNPFAGQK